MTYAGELAQTQTGVERDKNHWAEHEKNRWFDTKTG